jgi:hypothetical protein
MKRSGPMKRTPFKPKAWTPKPVKTFEVYTPRARAPAVAISDGKARMVAPVPKREPLKPGKTAPTVEERAWLDFIVSYGCIACHIDGHQGVPGEVHHLIYGQRRMGHLFTIPLCPGHHRDGTGAPGLIARHPWKARFEERYGSEESLLRKLKRERGGA